jgi:hypothetical protein
MGETLLGALARLPGKDDPLSAGWARFQTLVRAIDFLTASLESIRRLC